MRILVADYAGHPFQAQLSRQLATRGHQVLHAFAGAVGGPKGNLATLPGDPATLRFEALGRRRQDKLSPLSRVQAALAFGAELREAVRAFDAESVLAANVPPEGLLAADFGGDGRRWVWWVHDLFSAASRRFLLKRSRVTAAVAIPFYEWAERRIAARASAIVVIAQSFMALLPRGSEAKATVIHNWAPLDEMPLGNHDNAWAREQGLAETFNFVYSGTLALKHSPQLLVELATRTARRPSVRIVVVSDGPGAEYVAASARRLRLDNIRVLPFQPYGRLPEVLAASDVLVALLDEDAGAVSVPSKVLAYLCAGRPILAAIPDGNLARDVLVESRAGVVVPAGAEIEFVGAGLGLLADPDRRRSMGCAARTHAERVFDIERIVDRFLEVLEVP